MQSKPWQKYGCHLGKVCHSDDSDDLFGNFFSQFEFSCIIEILPADGGSCSGVQPRRPVQAIVTSLLLVRMSPNTVCVRACALMLAVVTCPFVITAYSREHE